MSYLSTRGGRRYFTAAALDPAAPVEPMVVRDGVANNLLHLADQAHSKVWVNDMPANSTIVTGNAPVTADLPSGSADFWTVQVYGPFDLSVIAYKGERIPYRVRVYLNATDLACTWAAKLCLPDDTASMESSVSLVSVAPNDFMLWPTLASATPAWLTPQSDDGMITPSRGLIDRARLAIRTLDGIGGEEAYVYTTAVCIKVMVTGTPGTLYGAHISEYLVLP